MAGSRPNRCCIWCILDVTKSVQRGRYKVQGVRDEAMVMETGGVPLGIRAQFQWRLPEEYSPTTQTCEFAQYNH
jgi:hypothetical protein